MKLGAFCARAPVQMQLGLFLLEATCAQFGGCLGPPAVLAEFPRPRRPTWCGQSPAVVSVGGPVRFLWAWAGRGRLPAGGCGLLSPRTCSGSSGLGAAFLSPGLWVGARSPGRCGLSSQVCVAEQGELRCLVSPRVRAPR